MHLDTIDWSRIDTALRLGHRNFPAFFNVHRIAWARAQLADPDQVALPVLTIAMDSGHGSFAPFNRAFREASGLTPTDFRRAACAADRKGRSILKTARIFQLREASRVRCCQE